MPDMILRLTGIAALALAVFAVSAYAQLDSICVSVSTRKRVLDDYDAFIAYGGV